MVIGGVFIIDYPIFEHTYELCLPIVAIRNFERIQFWRLDRSNFKSSPALLHLFLFVYEKHELCTPGLQSMVEGNIIYKVCSAKIKLKLSIATQTMLIYSMNLYSQSFGYSILVNFNHLNKYGDLQTRDL